MGLPRLPAVRGESSSVAVRGRWFAGRMWGMVTGSELAVLWIGGLVCVVIAVVSAIVAWLRGRS